MLQRAALAAILLLASALPLAAPAPSLNPVEQQVASARMWYDKYQMGTAREALRKALLMQPDAPEALALLGIIELKSNRQLEAFKALAQLQRVHPKHHATQELNDAYRVATRERPRMVKIRQLAKADKVEQAFKQMQELFPEGVPRGELGIEYYQLMARQPNLRGKALAGLAQLRRQQPLNMTYPLALIGLWVERDETREQGIKLAMELARRPDVNRDQALRRWRQGLMSAGENPDYLKWQEAYLLEDAQDSTIRDLVERTKVALDTRRKLEADPFWQAQQRGLKALDKNELARAEAALFEALKKRGDDPELHGALGRLRMRQGRHGEAVAFFAKAAAISKPEDKAEWEDLIATARFWGGMAEARELLAAGRLDAAEAKLQAAIAAQPKEPEARALLGDVYVARRDWRRAEQHYRAALELGSYNSSALQGWVKLLGDSGRASEVLPLLARYRARYPDGRAEIDELSARTLAAEADALVAARKSGRAIDKYEAAIKLLPDDAWIRFSLAKLYRDRGAPELGREVMQEGVERAASAEMRYASALYFSSVDEIEPALDVLARIAEAERSAGMRELEGRLRIRQARLEAQKAMQAGQREQALAVLDAARRAAGDSPDLLAELGQAYLSADLPERGLQILADWLMAHPGPEALPLRVRYAGLLAQAGKEEQLQRWLDQLEREPALSPEQRADLAEYRFQMALRQVERLQEAQQLAEAGQVLERLAAQWGKDVRFGRARAEWWFAQRRYQEAERAARQVLAQQPGDFDMRLLLARIKENTGQRDKALVELKSLLEDTPLEQVADRLAISRRLRALADYRAAAVLLNQLREQAPQDARPLVETGRLAAAQRRYEQAADWYRRAQALETPPLAGAEPSAASRALAELEERRQPMFETAYEHSVKPGDPGISNLELTEVPLYGQLPHRYDGHWFAHSDQVSISAGTVPRGDLDTASGFGQIAAFGLTELRGPLEQSASGTMVGVGYRNDTWRFDLGHTPLSFAASHWVGGVRWSDTIRDVSYSAELARRAVTSSLVSFAGAHDPVSGEVWGGVSRSGVNLRAGWDVGALGFSSSLSLGWLTGKNVLTNRELRLRQVVDWSALQRPNQRFTIGVVANYWNYANNQGGYTFGNGGYYSPQQYFSLSLPLELSGRAGRLSYRLAGSVGTSYTTSKGADYFPTRPDLQARAVQQAEVLDLSSPVTTGSSGPSRRPSFSLQLGLEYRLTPHLTLGGVYGVDRSESYTPDRMQLYLRYTAKPQRGPVDYPPSAVQPYSRY